jgi:tRNA A-37 threonylcarbamoyl transferase component Bud32
MGSGVARRIRALVPGTRLGRYVILDRIGHGGMAEVFLARGEGLSGFAKLVALKVIDADRVDDPTHVDMLLKEARIAATLDHPSIVQVFDVGAEGDEHYLAMEYVHGRDLRAVLRALAGAARMPLLLALHIVGELADALHYAHTKTDAHGRPLGIVHRDVSPSNAIVGFDGVVKLTDFGIAKITAHTSQTRTGTFKGKFGYMAPEQALQQDVDARSDVFSLGIVLYELTTGRRAFAGENAFAALNMAVEGKYTPPEALVEDYPERLAAIVRSALAVDREARPPSARALGEDVEALARELGGPASRAELATFVGDLFGWPAAPDVSAVEPIGVPDPVEDGVTVALPQRRATSRTTIVLGLGVAALAGVIGWRAGRETAIERASAAAPVEAPRVEAARPEPSTAASVDAPVEPSAPQPSAARAAVDPPAPPVVERTASSRGDGKRKRKPAKAAPTPARTDRGGLDDLLPPSAKP